jgi:hypothetical protein
MISNPQPASTMTFLDKVTGFFRKGRESGGGKSDLQKNMEKALQMKKDGEPKAQVPEHATARDGMHPAPDPYVSDATRGAEAGFTPQLKRSRVARSGDT